MNKLLQTIVDWGNIATGVIKWAILGLLGLLALAMVNGQMIDWLGGVSKAELAKALDLKLEDNPNYREIVAQMRNHGPGGGTAVPAGLVIASTLECSDLEPKNGWSEYELARGRTIIGVNLHSAHGLSKRDLEDDGGAETVTLIEAQMPRHRHPVRYGPGADIGIGPVKYLLATGDLESATAFVGGNQPHENMPPYIALYFCEKV